MDLSEIIQQPGEKELLFRDEIFKSLHVAMPGEVVSYNEEKRTAMIQLAIRDGDEKLPVLVDVPVFFWGNYVFTPQKGDGCLVVFADSCIDGWFQNGGVAKAITGRSHDLSDGFAFVGFRQTGGKSIEAMLSPVSKQADGLCPKLPNETSTNKYLRQDGTWDVPSESSYQLPLAGNGTRGGVQIGYLEAGKKYAVKLDGEQMYVEVPWQEYTLPLAADGTKGGIQVGYEQSGKNYPVQLSNEKAYVNVPWNDTTYGVVSKNSNGLCPQLPNENTTKKYLRQDGLWIEPPIPDVMTGATATTAGTAGIVPAPGSGSQDKVLRGDGTWGTVDALPDVSSVDNDKILQVVNGEWAVSNALTNVFRDVSFSIDTTDWVGSSAPYTATKPISELESGSFVWVFFGSEYENYALDIVLYAPSVGQMVFTTNIKPTGTITGIVRIANKVPIATVSQELLDTKVDIAQGSQNSGMFMQVGSDGNLTPGEVFPYETVTNWDTFVPLDSSKPTRRQGLSVGGTATGSPYSGDNATFYGYVEGYPTYWTQHLTVQYAATSSNSNREYIRCRLGSGSTPGDWVEIERKISVGGVYNNTSLANVDTDLKAKYGNLFTVSFAYAGTPTDSMPTGFYLAIRNGNMSANTRFMPLGSSQYINAFLINGNKTSPTTVNDTGLYGGYWFKDTDITGMPTSNGGYYNLLAFGTVQIAVRWSSSGPSELYSRSHANSQWYAWTRVGKNNSVTTVTNASKSMTTSNAYLGTYVTLAYPAVVTAYQNYNAVHPKTIGLSTSSTSFVGEMAAAGNSNNVVLTTLLAAGTYYLWGSADAAGNNTCILRYVYV